MFECKFCKSSLIAYSDKWDAYYCQRCRGWQETKCRARDCEICSKRPLLEDSHD